MHQKYHVVNVREGTYLQFFVATMSGRPTLDFGSRGNATEFTRAQAQAACCLLATLPGGVSNLSIEEA